MMIWGLKEAAHLSSILLFGFSPVFNSWIVFGLTFLGASTFALMPYSLNDLSIAIFHYTTKTLGIK
jgi:hypothetical protein